MRCGGPVPLLHCLLLLLVSLLKLLALLRVPLFSLLLARLVGPFRGLLIFLLLPLLEFLPFLVLLGRELVLLLLISPVQVGITCVGRGRTLHWRKILDMGRWCSHGPSLLGPSRRCVILPSRFPRRNDVVTAKFSGPGGRSNGRPAVICRSPQLRISASLLDVLPLRSYGVDVPIMLGNFFLRGGPGRDAALAAVVADMVDYFAIDYGFVVNVVNVDDVDIGDGAVIEEMSAIPTAANEANAEISKAVINAAVEADVRAPETFVEKKHAAIPTPPRRSPQVTDLGSKDPGAG